LDPSEELTTLEQGMLLAALIHDDGAPLSRIAGVDRCRQIHGDLREGDPARRRRTALLLSRRLFAPMPANLERVDPSWIEHLLQRESAAVAGIVLEALPAAVAARLALDAAPPPGAILPWVRARLCRSVLTVIEPMPPQRKTADPRPEELACLDRAELEQLLTAVGLLELARLVRQAEDPRLPARVEATLPRGLQPCFAKALATDLSAPPTRSTGLQLPALPRASSSSLHAGADSMDRRLLGLALQVLGPALDRQGRRQLAQRLPRPVSLPLWRLDAEVDHRAVEPTRRLVQLAGRWLPLDIGGGA